MKKSFLILFLIFFSLQSRSQVNIQIGKYNEIVCKVTPNEPNDLTELIPFEKLFCDKTIIGMGEATHGTREFSNMKAKMFKFLATHCGFRVFAIEAPYGGTMKVNDYVLYGRGDVLSAMKGMEYWTWDTEEVKELIEWMRLYNTGKGEKEKLKFYGFDCQSFKGTANALLDYVKEYDKENLSKFSKGMSVLKDSSYLFFNKLRDAHTGEKGIAEINEIISFLGNWFNENQETYIARSGSEKYTLSFHNIEILKQTLVLSECTYNKAFPLRDSCMARNIKWIYEFENSKVFAWAHNAHIYYGSTHFFGKDKNMGANLNELFGKAYYKIGFVFNEGSFQAYKGPKALYKNGLKEFSVPAYKKNTLTTALSIPGIDAFFIDLNSSNNPLFLSNQRCYEIGALFDNYKISSVPISAKKEFDGLIFIGKTTRAIPINRK